MSTTIVINTGGDGPKPVVYVGGEGAGPKPLIYGGGDGPCPGNRSRPDFVNALIWSSRGS